MRDTERLTEIAAELQGIPRYGPEAANLRQEQEEVQQRVAARQQEQQLGEAAKTKTDKPTTNKARDKEKQSGTNNGKEKPNKQSGKVSTTPRTGYIFHKVRFLRTLADNACGLHSARTCWKKLKKLSKESELLREDTQTSTGSYRSCAAHLAKSNPILSCEFVCGLVSLSLDL